MNVTKILHLAKIYSGMNWQSWGTSDLSDIHQLLTALTQKRVIKYETEMLQDEPVPLEETVHKSSAEILHGLIAEAVNEGNYYAVQEMLEQMLVMCDELVEDEKSKLNYRAS